MIAIGEFRFGLLGSRLREPLAEKLDALIRQSVVFDVTETTTQHYAELRQALKAAGTPIPANDLWIAALARQHALAILSRDAHFDDVRGITRIAW